MVSKNALVASILEDIEATRRQLEAKDKEIQSLTEKNLVLAQRLVETLTKMNELGEKLPPLTEYPGVQ